MQQFGLIGFPLSHSFSKKYFTEKFLKENISATYELFPLTEIKEVSNLIKVNPGLKGLNVTIPYKKQVIPFLKDATDAVQKMNACNCISIENGNLFGYNTDVIGFEVSLKKQLEPHHTKALVLGTGGAAAAVEFVLQKLKIEYLLVSRRKDQINTITYNDVNERQIRENLLIINTTPLGMYPNVDDCPAIPYQFLTKQHYLYDLVYNPAKTLFLKKGEEQGAAIMNGEEMLIIQAEESWKIWNKKIL